MLPGKITFGYTLIPAETEKFFHKKQSFVLKLLSGSTKFIPTVILPQRSHFVNYNNAQFIAAVSRAALPFTLTISMGWCIVYLLSKTANERM